MDIVGMYRRLLRLYPAGFREAYARPMEEQFREEHEEARGGWERWGFWAHALADLAVSVPRELGRELGQDLRFARRSYTRRLLSTVLAVTALALSIGVTTGVFSVVNALLLKRLPFADPSRLVELRLSPFTAMNGHGAFRAWKDRSAYLADASTFSNSEMNFDSGREALRVKVTETSANFFSMLGAGMSLGRAFGEGEDEGGRTHVAVISHGLWQEAFGGDPSVLGSTIHLNGVALTVVGVAAPGFDYPGKVNVWTPTVFDFETVPKHGAFVVETIARLKRGVSMRQAREAFRAQASAASPQSYAAGNAEVPTVVGLRDQIASALRQSALILAGVVLLVLVAACANVAQLLLSRATERREELALRSALGASQARLVQQLTTEAMALTCAGAALGLVVALGTCRLASAVLPAELATQTYSLLDWRVLLFAVGLALAAGAFFGVMPGWITGRFGSPFTRVQPGVQTRASRGMRSAIIALQVAITLVLIAGSFTLGSAFLHLRGRDLGFRPANVVTLNVSLQGTKYQGRAAWEYYSTVLERLRAIDGVKEAGAVGYLPLANDVYMAGTIKLDSGQQVGQVVLNGTMPGFFGAMGTRILAGRDFRMEDGGSGGPTVMVNEAFAREAHAGNNLVGRSIIAPWTEHPYMISGIVETVRLAGPEFDGGPQVYWPVREDPGPKLTFVVKTRGDASRFVAQCRNVVLGVDRSVPVFQAETLDERLERTLARPRFYTTAVVFLGCLALLLAVTGIYGAASYTVEQRKHELGVRVALGAMPEGVRRMILRQSLRPVMLGLVAGLAGAIASERLMEHLITGAQAFGWTTCVSAVAVLVATAALATWGATVRILAIDPIQALRSE